MRFSPLLAAMLPPDLREHFCNIFVKILEAEGLSHPVIRQQEMQHLPVAR